MSDLLPGNYDTWRQGTFGRFEHAQARRAEALSEAMDAIRADAEDLHSALEDVDALYDLVKYAMTGDRAALDRVIDSAIEHAAEKRITEEAS